QLEAEPLPDLRFLDRGKVEHVNGRRPQPAEAARNVADRVRALLGCVRLETRSIEPVVPVPLAAWQHDLGGMGVIDVVAQSKRLACLELVIAAKLPAIDDSGHRPGSVREEMPAAAEGQFVNPRSS